MGAGLYSAGQPAQRRGRMRRARAGQPMSEINVTPFVDVMLVLLIVFMVAAPLLTVGVEVDLPEGAWRLDRAAPFEASIGGGRLHLPAWQAGFALRDDDTTH